MSAPDPAVLPLDSADWRWSPGRVAPSPPSAACAGVAVTLPHCWNAAEEYIPGVLPRRGWGTYQLDFEFPDQESNREWRLRCEGFYGVGQAWVNQVCVGRFNGDYLGIDLVAPAAIREGPNRLTIQVCNRHSRRILPGIPDPDFHLYGGLGGGMHWISLPKVRLVRAECRTTYDESNPGEVVVEIGMENRTGHGAARSLQIVVRDPSGHVAAMPDPLAVTIPANGSAQRAIRCTLSSPQLWSPDAPRLYAVKATLREGPQIRDCQDWTFGLRTARYDPEAGLTLNGQPIMLRGVNRHENLPGFGSALPRPLHLADARRIKDLGLNFVRLSHYPQSPAFLDACDRLGLLVYAELCSWKRIGGGSWLAAAEAQFERMVRRDRHHPAIILWGLGNEGRHRQAFLRLKALACALDPSRATIYAENHAYRARRKKTAGLTDVWGLNYEFDALDFARAASPTGCVVVTEAANLPYARRGHWPAEAEQTALIREAVRRVEGAGPGAIGWALWGFADYATPRRQRWFRECGIVDGWRTGKMAADWIQACFGSSPFLSVRGDWSFAAGPLRRLYLVTNCPAVEILRADGNRQRLDTPSPNLYEVDLHFDGAPIRFVGQHPRQTVEVRLDPWSAPAAFFLQADPPMPGAADTLAPLLRCVLQVVDAKGTAVMGYEGEARVQLPAGLHASLIGGDRVPVHAGQAAFYVEAPCHETNIPLHCTLDDFTPQSLRLFADAAPPPRSRP